MHEAQFLILKARARRLKPEPVPSPENSGPTHLLSKSVRAEAGAASGPCHRRCLNVSSFQRSEAALRAHNQLTSVSINQSNNLFIKDQTQTL
jgi:hypothetical protein